MSKSLADILLPEKALLFRITHRDNVPHIVQHGLHCSHSAIQNPDFVSIGDPGVIDARKDRIVPVSPGGTLSDYALFYFTPCSIMLFKIVTGHGGVRKRSREEIAILVTSLDKIAEHGGTVVLSDRNAALAAAEFSVERMALASMPWEDWQNKKFTRIPERPQDFERYQAEALVHQQLPSTALLGIVTASADVASQLEPLVKNVLSSVPVYSRPHWFFT